MRAIAAARRDGEAGQPARSDRTDGVDLLRAGSHRWMPSLASPSPISVLTPRSIEPGPGFVLLSGENGAGKTNLLEAVSLLTPGRGLRGAPLSEMARQRRLRGAASRVGGAGCGDIDIGTGTLARRARAAAGAHQRRAGVGQFALANGCRSCG